MAEIRNQFECVKLDLERPGIDAQACAVVRDAVVPGVICYSYDRPPGYARFAEMQGKQFELYGVFAQEKLVAITQVTFDRVYFNGRPTEIAYSGDTRVHTAARGKKLADLMLARSCNQSVPVLGAVLGTNELVLNKKFADWKKIGVDFQPVGDSRVLLFLTKKNVTKKNESVTAAQEQDYEELFTLWKKEKTTQQLARVYETLADFKESYRQRGITTADILVQRKNNKIVAYLAVWTQETARTIRVQKDSQLIRIARPFLKPWISIPKTGESLFILYSFQHCFSKEAAPEDLLALLANARARAKEKGALFFAIALDPQDFSYPAFKKKASVENTVKLVCHDSKGSFHSEKGSVFHLEVGYG